MQGQFESEGVYIKKKQGDSEGTSAVGHRLLASFLFFSGWVIITLLITDVRVERQDGHFPKEGYPRVLPKIE